MDKKGLAPEHLAKLLILKVFVTLVHPGALFSLDY